MKLQDQNRTQVTRTSFEKYLRVNVILLRTYGLLPLSPNSNISKKFLDIFVVFTVPTLMNAVIIPTIILTLFNEQLDMNVLMESLAGSTQAYGLQMKYIALVLRRREIKELIESCQDLWETNHPRGYDVLSQYVKKGFLLTCGFLCSVGLTSTSFAIVPYILEPNSVLQTLPATPGFIINSTILYDITWSAQFLTICVGGISVAGIDSLLPVLLIISCGQFKLIRIMLNDLKNKYEAENADVNANEDFKRLFKVGLDECTTRHQRLLAHYAKIEENLNLYCLVQMLIGFSTISLALLSFTLGSSDAFKYPTVLITGIMQIFFCNWPCEKVIEESNETNLAVYNLPWYTKEFNSQKTMSLLLLMTQRPIRLTAGKFYYLSMQTFSTALTNAFSFFTVLQTLM